MKVVLMVTMSPLKFDSRVDREASALVDAGYKVFVLGLAPFPENPTWTPIEVGMVAISKSSAGKRSSSFWRFIKYLTLVPYRYLKRQKFIKRVRERIKEIRDLTVIDVIHAHDLPALEATKPFHKEFLLIYDSHELWTGRKLKGLGSRFELLRDARIEALQVQYASAVITVSDQLAEELTNRFGQEVQVIRNTFPISTASPPQRINFLAYAGNISEGRDLNTVIDGASKAAIDIRLMGRRVSNFQFKSPLEIDDHGSVEEAGKFLRDGGIAVVSLESGIENHQRALPNKLLQAVAEGVPVIAADFPAIAQIVRSNNLGVLYEPGDSISFANSVKQVSENYSQFVENALIARNTLCWNLDSELLCNIYAKISIE